MVYRRKWLKCKWGMHFVCCYYNGKRDQGMKSSERNWAHLTRQLKLASGIGHVHSMYYGLICRSNQNAGIFFTLWLLKTYSAGHLPTSFYWSFHFSHRSVKPFMQLYKALKIIVQEWLLVACCLCGIFCLNASITMSPDNLWKVYIKHLRSQLKGVLML